MFLDRSWPIRGGAAKTILYINLKIFDKISVPSKIL